jgi:hypothetical protein
MRGRGPVPEADDAELVGVRVDPAALEVEACGDLASGQKSMRPERVVATEQLGNLTRDSHDARVVRRGFRRQRHLTTQPVVTNALEHLPARASGVRSGFHAATGLATDRRDNALGEWIGDIRVYL